MTAPYQHIADYLADRHHEEAAIPMQANPSMPVITRHDLKDVQSLLGLADEHIECITLHAHGMTVKQWLLDENGKIYWDPAYNGAAYVHYTVLLS